MHPKFTPKKLLLFIVIVAASLSVVHFFRSPKGIIYRHTGILLPYSAAILHYEDTYQSWFDSYGIIRVVAEIDSTYCGELLNKPPWAEAWKNGRLTSNPYMVRILPDHLWDDLAGTKVVYDVIHWNQSSPHSVIAINEAKGILLFYAE